MSLPDRVGKERLLIMLNSFFSKVLAQKQWNILQLNFTLIKYQNKKYSTKKDKCVAVGYAFSKRIRLKVVLAEAHINSWVKLKIELDTLIATEKYNLKLLEAFMKTSLISKHNLVKV